MSYRKVFRTALRATGNPMSEAVRVRKKKDYTKEGGSGLLLQRPVHLPRASTVASTKNKYGKGHILTLLLYIISWVFIIAVLIPSAEGKLILTASALAPFIVFFSIWLAIKRGCDA